MSERDAAGNRRLSRYSDDPGSNPGAEPAGVDPDDRPEYLRADVGTEETEDVGGGDVQCVDCESSAYFEDPNAALGNDALPSKPLCRTHILDRA